MQQKYKINELKTVVRYIKLSISHKKLSIGVSEAYRCLSLVITFFVDMGLSRFLKVTLIYEYDVIHCVKSGRIRSFSIPYFPTFGLNTERYSVSLRIHSTYGKIQIRKTPNTNTFHVFISILQISPSWISAPESSCCPSLAITVLVDIIAHKKMKFSIKVFFSKCDEIRSFLCVWSHLLKKSLMENFIFRAVHGILVFCRRHATL